MPVNIRRGSARLTSAVLTEVDVFGRRLSLSKPTRFLTLRINGAIAMSDTPQEVMMMRRDARGARGKALVAGLGLGIIVDAIKDRCSSVTVVEKNPDVIALYRAWKGEAAHDDIVESTIEDFLATTAERYDYIHLDTWYSMDTQFLPHVNWLIRQAKGRLQSRGRVAAWARDVMIRQFAKECMELYEGRAVYRKAPAQKIDTLRAIYPINAAAIEWLRANPRATPERFMRWAGQYARSVCARSAEPLEVASEMNALRLVAAQYSPLGSYDLSKPLPGSCDGIKL